MIQCCADEAVEAGNPAPKNGINPGEYLELQLTYTDPPHNFIDMLESGELRIGLHVINIGMYSESFINVVPEPASLFLIGATASTFALVRRRLVA